MIRSTITALLLALVSSNTWAAASSHATVFARPAQATTIFTPAAAKCDVSACQANCSVAQSQCNDKQGSGCSSQQVNCVQACAAQCR